MKYTKEVIKPQWELDEEALDRDLAIAFGTKDWESLLIDALETSGNDLYGYDGGMMKFKDKIIGLRTKDR